MHGHVTCIGILLVQVIQAHEAAKAAGNLFQVEKHAKAGIS